MTLTKRPLPRVVLIDPEALQHPFAVYAKAREAAPLVRLLAPGLTPIWGVTRHRDAKAMLADARLVLTQRSFIRPDTPGEYMVSMQMMLTDGPTHKRLRRLTSPGFLPRRSAKFREHIQSIVDDLLDALVESETDGVVDLFKNFARPLPTDVICAFIGIPESDRLHWREYGAAAAEAGDGFANAMPGIVKSTHDAIAYRRNNPGEDLISDLVRIHHDDEDRLSDPEMVTLILVLVLSSGTTTNFMANSVLALLAHPDQLALLRNDNMLMAMAIEELMRWCGPDLLTAPRYTLEDVEIAGVRIPEGEPVMAVIASANRDPRVFDDPERLDITRPIAQSSEQLGFAHGAHYCIGAAVARVMADVALTTLFRRFPDLALASTSPEIEAAHRVADPGTWRLDSLPQFTSLLERRH